MSIHPDGTGTGWTNVETVDVNQPHGKDYIYSQHIAKGVRKRMNQEHSTFADATVGGIHKPGGAAVLGECDGTPGAADGTYRGHGIVWDLSSRLWCSTAVAGASTSGDFTVITLHPDLQWKGGDVTWAGAHEFDGSVDISGNVAMDGDLTVDGVLKVDSSCEISDIYINGDLSMTGSIKVATDVSITGDMAIDGTSNFYDECDFSAVNFSSLLSGVFGIYTNEDDDGNAMVVDHAYLCNQDGEVEVIITEGNNATIDVKGYDDSDANPAAGGVIRARYYTIHYGATGAVKSFNFKMKSGRYFEITASFATVVIRWIPIGTLVKPTDQD